MKTEFLKGLELTDEQIRAIQAESGKDVQAEKDKRMAAEDRLSKANEKISNLEGDLTALKDTDPEGLKRKIGELEQQIADRKAEDEKAVMEKNMTERFEKVLGDGKFVNDITKSGVYAEFKAALLDENNKGKSDADIYDSLTKDRADLFASKNPEVDIPGSGGNGAEIDENEIRAVMGLAPLKN